jgi:hypothetical protein
LTLAAALFGAVIGYADEQDPVDAAVYAAICAGFVVWAHISLWRKGELPHSSPVPKRYMRWGLLGGGLVLAVVVAAIGGYAALQATRDEAGFLMRDSWVALQPIASLKGVRLGEGLKDVDARMGHFEPDPDAPPPDGSRRRHYAQGTSRIKLLVDQDVVTRITYECDIRDSTRVNRIGCHDARRRVHEVFGNAARSLCPNPAAPSQTSSDALLFDVLDTGTRYVVQDGRVVSFVVMEPQALEDALGAEPTWRRC